MHVNTLFLLCKTQYGLENMQLCHIYVNIYSFYPKNHVPTICVISVTKVTESVFSDEKGIETPMMPSTLAVSHTACCPGKVSLHILFKIYKI